MKSCFAFCIVHFSLWNCVSAAEPLRKTLTSVESNIHTTAWSQEIEGGGFVRKQTLHGGKQEGVEIVTVNNGKLQFVVIPTRGMSIREVFMDDIRLGWHSPVKETVHPKFIDLQERGGLGWLEGFNEWMVRCGLEFAGHPGKDEFINNVGDKAEMELTLHGKIGNIPASEVEVIIERDPPRRIRVRGRVDERMFYGPKLELWTEISTEGGSSSFRIEDTIKSHSAFEQEFQIIYHANYGPPLLEKGAQFVGAAKRITPFNAHAAKGMQTFGTYAGPTKGFIEQVYCIEPYADASGKTTIMLHNASATRAVTMSYSVQQLPFLTLWKNTNAEEEGYVTGLEPGTGYPYNRRIERKSGRVPRLAPGASRSFAIDFQMLGAGDAITATKAAIRNIQGSRPTQTDPEPFQID